MRFPPTLPRIPGLPDPLHRIPIPDDLKSVTAIADEIDPTDVGMTRDSVERVWRAVERLYLSGVHPAVALCVRREGQVVLDRAIGHSHGNGPGDDEHTEKVLATPATPFVIASASKSVTAMVAHLLDERGLIHIGDRVAEYIPEYGTNGKDAITIAHVLAHRAGVPNLPPEVLKQENIDNEALLLQALCDATPSTRPGKGLAYHAISGGYITAEVVRRVTGKPIRQVLAEEILDPLGFRWGNYGVASEDMPLVARNYHTGAPVLPPLSTLLRRGLGVSVKEAVELMNDPKVLTGTVPSVNVVTTANELSRFFELLRAGGELDGVRIFEPRTIRRAVTEQSYMELDLSLGFPTRFSLGFMLGAKWLSLYGPDTELAFGHLGFTNILGWADPERAVSAAILTSGKPVVYPELAEMWRVTRRIGRAAPKVKI